MTEKVDKYIRGGLFLCGLPFLYYVITRTEPDWLYYTSLLFIFAGMIYSLVADWHLGKKKEVKRRLMMYGIFIAILIILALVSG
jgi:hypothetical protein